MAGNAILARRAWRPIRRVAHLCRRHIALQPQCDIRSLIDRMMLHWVQAHRPDSRLSTHCRGSGSTAEAAPAHGICPLRCPFPASVAKPDALASPGNAIGRGSKRNASSPRKNRAGQSGNTCRRKRQSRRIQVSRRYRINGRNLVHKRSTASGTGKYPRVGKIASACTLGRGRSYSSYFSEIRSDGREYSGRKYWSH